MPRPIIGITASGLMAEGGNEKVSVNEDYIRAVLRVNGVPVILPSVIEKESLAAQADLLDGLVLSGGFDIHPLFYGEQPEPKLGFCDLQRDEYEFKLVQMVARKHKPILGICRGIQVLNVAFGGTLYQDISQKSGPWLQHMQQARRDSPIHIVDVEKDSHLFHLMGEETLFVNSFHHQSIKDPAPGFRVTARTRDGVIEAIEGVGDTFFLGVQWHPEMMILVQPEMQKLFRHFVETAEERKTENVTK